MKINERLLESLASDSSPPDKAGFLLKKGEVNKGFQRRYFVLRGNLLFYFEKEHDRTPIGVIILENCHVELCSSEETRFAFQIIFCGSGTRRYILSADDNDDMLHWMTRITHAGFNFMQTLVEDLEKRLEKVQKVESEMVTDNPEQEVVAPLSSPPRVDKCEQLVVLDDKQSPLAAEANQSIPQAIRPIPAPFRRSKYKTMPAKKSAKKEKVSLMDLGSRWSMSVPKTNSEFHVARSNWVNFSERTDLLFNDSNDLTRRFSINDFTPPSFLELKRHEQIEDDALLLDLSTQENKVHMHETALPNSLANKIKANRRTKSERHRRGAPTMPFNRRTVGGTSSRNGDQSRTVPSNATVDDMDDQSSSESHFHYLHRLWGASIWVKVREFEVRQEKVIETEV